MNKVVAILCADLHLSLKPPSMRKSESDWLEAQSRPLQEIRQLAKQHQVSIICAGDIFHKWNPPIELVNWACLQLPHMYAIPGNHDLPNHRNDLVHRSAFEALVKMGRVTPIVERAVRLGRLHITGSKIGGKYPKPTRKTSVLVAHHFIWTDTTGYHGAPKKSLVGEERNPFGDYLTVVVGDNHIPFSLKSGRTTIVNCGTPIRRTATDKKMSPTVWLLRSSGNVEPVVLKSTKKDAKYGRSIQTRDNEKTAKILEEIANMRGDLLDYGRRLTEAAKGEIPAVRSILHEAMEE